MVSEIVELTKYLTEKNSSSVIILCIILILVFKSRSLVYFFLELKDLGKKRLLEKFERESKLKDQTFLSQDLNNDYLRYCEELQLHTIIGDKDCTPTMAAYILSRENISDAISKYLRIKDIIKYDDVKRRPVTCTNFSKKREQLNAFGGFIFYLLFVFLAVSPYFLFTLLSKEEQQILINKLTLSQVIVLILLFIIFLYFAVSTLISGLKPRLANNFCSLPSKSEIFIDM